MIGPGGGAKAQYLVKSAPDSGYVLAIGLDQAEFTSSLPNFITTRNAEYINAEFSSFAQGTALAGIGPSDVYNREPRKIALIVDADHVIDGGVMATSRADHVVLFQLAPWTFSLDQQNTRRVFRHTSVTLSRLLGNMGVHGSTPLLERFSSPVGPGEQRWLTGFYLDKPVDTDDPYRFFGW